MSWQALFVPAKTPSGIINKINADTVSALADSTIQPRLQQMGYVSSSSTPDELGKMLKVEIGKWAAVINDAGLKVE
jgi:tripartite-type tricarboxylate transporter receptor subunit TctC